MTTADSDGSIVVRLVDGDLTLNDGTAPADADGRAVLADGTGNILLETIVDTGSVTVNADVESEGGHISIVAGSGITFTAGADIDTVGAGTMDLEARTGSILLSTTSDQTTGSGDIRFFAYVNITLGGLTRTTGSVSVTADTGWIHDGDSDGSVDIEASGLRLDAAVEVGQLGESVNPIETTVTTVSARAGAGGISLLESDDLIVDDTTVTINRVDIDGTTDGETDIRTDAVRSDLVTADGSDGSIVVRLVNGNFTLNDGTAPADGDGRAVLADGTGNILLETIADTGSVTANADVESEGGHISIVAGDGIEFTALADIDTQAGGTIDLEARTGSILLSTTSNQTTGSGDVRFLAYVNVTLGGVAHTTGSVSVTADTGWIHDGDSDGGVDIEATGLRLDAQVEIGQLGESVNPIETTVTTVSARTGAGGINLLESDDLIVDDTTVTINRVDTDATTDGVTDIVMDAVQSDLVTTDGSNGSIVVRLVDGNLTLNDGTAPADADDRAVLADGTGNILLESIADTGSVTANADVESEGGHISIVAGSGITFTAGAGIDTVGTGTMDLEARTGSILLSTTSNQTTGSGDVRFLAYVNVILGGVTHTTGSVSVTADTGWIHDGDSDGSVDIEATGLRLDGQVEVGQLGESVNPIETTVTTVSARAGSGGLNLLESDDLVVDDTTVTVNRVDVDATTDGEADIRTDAVRSDIVTTDGSNGSIVVRLVDGDLTLNNGTAPADADGRAVLANGAGNILLETIADAKSVTANADVESEGGHISIVAGSGITFTAGADIDTVGTGTIDLEARTGSILLSTTSNQTTGSGDIRFFAHVNVTLGGLVHTTGSVSVTADTGWIHDGDSDGSVDIKATGLRLDAAVEVGQLGIDVNPIETTVTTVSARAGAGGISLLESDDLIVDDTTVTINRVDIDATTDGVTDIRTDAVQSDVVTTADSDGSIVVRLVDGDLTLNDGTEPADADGRAVLADGTGRILLETISDTGSVTANADVESESGHISIVAGSGITFTDGADIDTVGAGTMDLEARTGSILLSTTSDQTTGSGDIRFFAYVNITLGGMTHTTGSVSLTADTGWIHDGDSDGNVDIEASGLRLDAAVEVGQLGESVNPIETTVTTVSARAGAGGISLLESDDLIVDDTTVAVNRVDVDATTDGVTDVVTDLTQSDLVTTDGSDGSIVVRLVDGNLTLNDGSTPDDDRAVRADGIGSVLLEIVGAGRDALIYAGVASGTGNVVVSTAGSVAQGPAGYIATTTGDIDVTATAGSITMADGAFASSGGGTIGYSAGTDVHIGGLHAGTGDVTVVADAGGIYDNGDSDADIEGRSVTLTAELGIGSGVNGALETRLTEISSTSYSGDIAIDNVTAPSVTITDIATGTGNIAFSQSGGGALMVTSVVTLEGTITIDVTDGDLTAGEVTAGGEGNVVLSTLQAGDVKVGVVTAVGDSITVNSAGSIVETAQGDTGADFIADDLVLSAGAHIGGSGEGDIETRVDRLEAISTGEGDILITEEDTVVLTNVEAADGTIHITAQDTITAENVALVADSGSLGIYLQSVGGDIAIGRVYAGGLGSVSLRAENGALVDGLLNEGANVSAGSTLLRAHGGIGSADDLDTNVESLDALNTGPGNIRINEIGAGGGLELSLIEQTGEDGGSVLITSENGPLTVSGPVSVSGAGNVLLQAGGVNGDVILDAEVNAASGDISVIGYGSVVQNCSVSTGGGSVDVEATTGSIGMANGVVTSSHGGNIRYSAAVDAAVTGLDAFVGDVSVIAVSGSISDSGDLEESDITGINLRLSAGANIGLGNGLETAVITVAARTGSGEIRFTDADSLTVGTVSESENPISVGRVCDDGTVGIVVDPVMSGLSTGGGAIHVGNLDRTLHVPDPVRVEGDGHIFLQAHGGSVEISSSVTSVGGIVAVAESDTISFKWEEAAGALAYSLQITKDGVPFDSPWVPDATEWTTPYSVDEGEYSITIEPWAPEGFMDPCEPLLFTMGDRVSIQSPEGTVTNEVPTFQWDAVEGAKWYQMTIVQNGNVIESRWVEGVASLTLDYTPAPGTYEWTVKAYGTELSVLRSAPAEFTVLSIEEAQPVTPPENVPLYGSDFVLSWDAVEDAEWYHVKILRDGRAYASEWVRGTSPQWSSDGLLPWGEYEWAVVSVGEDGVGVTSALQTFYVAAVP